MLELSINNKSFMSVKLPTKETMNSENPELITIHILSPKRKLMTKLRALSDISESEFDKGYDAVADILSNNRDNIVYTTEYTDELPLPDIIAIIKAYIEFIGSITSNPN